MAALRLDLLTGADRWTADAGAGGGGDLSTSPLVLPDGTVLWGTAGHELVAFSAAGQRLWSESLPGRATSPASADGRRVLVGDTGGGVTAFDVGGSGHRRAWTLDVGSTSYGSVVTAGAGRVYQSVDSELVAIDDRGGVGAVAWRAAPGDGITEVSAGLAADGTVLLGTNGVREWAYRPDGTAAWDAPGHHVLVAVGHRGRARVRGRPLRAGTGPRCRRRRGAGRLPARSAAADLDGGRGRPGAPALLRHAGRAAAGCVDPDGTVLFDIALGSSVWAYPALTGDGAVVIGSRNGELVAVGGPVGGR